MKIELRNASRSFDSETVFSKQNLIISTGSLVAVIGDNGEGKTTLVESIYGLQELDEGTVSWDDNEFDRHDVALRRRAFYLPFAPPLNVFQTGLFHLAEWFRFWSVDHDEAISQALDYLERFEVIDLVGRPMAKLSRGQQYKVALSGFFSLGADLWIFDEPFATGMDGKGIEIFRNVCREAVADGKTVIYTIQIPELTDGFASHVCDVTGENISLIEK